MQTPVEKKRIKRNWTKEEIEYLTEFWGKVSVPILAKNLNRSENAVICKKGRLGLGAFLEANDLISVNELFRCLGKSYGTEGVEAFRKRGLKIKYRKVKKNCFLMVSIDDFWKFAEKNKHFIDFSRLEPLILGEEPEWLTEARKTDFVYNHKKTKWTSADDTALKLYISMGYGYRRISQELNRTEAAVKRRAYDLKIKERPARNKTR